MTKQEQVKAIFIEEAGEIIEKLDVDILRFEENSADFNLLNEIFRGVHTLKGNANAFGFTRLGEFVHHFEDVLDHYRSTQEDVEEHHLELFVGSVDIIKEVMTCELDALSELPSEYGGCLERIKKLIASKKNLPIEDLLEEACGSLNDLASEFGLSCTEQFENALSNAVQLHQASQAEGLNLYRIDLMLDADTYKRGFDHLLFLKLLGEKAASMESFFDMEAVPPLGQFTCDENMIRRVGTIVLTPKPTTFFCVIFVFI
jgi:two-component system chemotaxis sensor kinase CheA